MSPDCEFVVYVTYSHLFTLLADAPNRFDPLLELMVRIRPHGSQSVVVINECGSP